jgi:hypothetical protein
MRRSKWQLAGVNKNLTADDADTADAKEVAKLESGQTSFYQRRQRYQR